MTSYPTYDASPYPYASYETIPYPYVPYDANPYPPYAAMPYSIYPTVTYDPFWPSRVTPSNRPLLLVPPHKRFRGEIRAGNCLMIVE